MEVAHEALLRRWGRLRKWIEGEREGLRIRRDLTRAASKWDTKGRRRDDLCRGSDLEDSEKWSRAHPGQETELEREYLQASVKLRRKARAIKSTALTVISLAIAVFMGFLGWQYYTSRILEERTLDRGILLQLEKEVRVRSQIN